MVMWGGGSFQAVMWGWGGVPSGDIVLVRNLVEPWGVVASW